MNSIGILVVTYNQYEITKNFIENYLNLFPLKKYHLLILDNNSSDKTYDRIKNIYPEIDIRKLNGNYGCVTGRNIGIVELINIGYEYIYISDNDIEFKDKELFDNLYKYHKNNQDIDASCPVVKWFDDGKIQTLGTREIRKNRYKNITIPDNNLFINSLPGCAQFVKSTAFIKYGIYDNDLSPFGIEDLDWGLRVTKKGAKLKCFSDAEVFHMHKRGQKSSKENMMHIIISRMVFLRKNFTLFNLLRETSHFILCLKDYGFKFTLSNYKKGIKKNIIPGNYEYNLFKMNIDKYYA